MLIKDIRFNAIEASKFIGVSPKSIQLWCKSGKIKAMKDTKTRQWIIKGRDLATFLYFNPRYQCYLRGSTYLGIRGMMRQVILNDIESRPFIYHTNLLADIFDVGVDTVSYWVERGYLPKMDQRTTYGEDLFSEEDLNTFLDNCPRYLKQFNPYLQTKKYF